MEREEVVPEEFRCKRSDGKQWRCSARSMPDKTVCEKHYIQAKKRAANSAMRASQKKMKKKDENGMEIGPDSNENEAERQFPNRDIQMTQSSKKLKEKVSKVNAVYSPASSTRLAQHSAEDMDLDVGRSQSDERDLDLQQYESNMPSKAKGSKSVDCSSKSNGNFGEAKNALCHLCQKSNRGKLVTCLKCKQKSYCTSCISKWYPRQSQDVIEKSCPVCCGNCSCKSCLWGEQQIKQQKANISEKIRSLYYLLSMTLPVLKQIHDEQCSEVEVEARIQGHSLRTSDIPRGKLNEDEILTCNRCDMTVLDFHRNCPNCSYDLCLKCCHELRDGKQPGHTRTSHWNINRDGSIPCPPEPFGGCGNTCLVLKRIFKANWIAKIEKDVEEVSGSCKVAENLKTSSPCSTCYKSISYEKNTHPERKLRETSHQKYSNDNFLYCPTIQDIKVEGIAHFQKHWFKGQPVIVQGLLQSISGLDWEPNIWCGALQGSSNGKSSDETKTVKAIDCLTWSEVDITIQQFFNGYLEGRTSKNGWPEMLKLTNWPPPNFFEERLPRHRADFINALPFCEYTHPEWGILNLASRLPKSLSKTLLGPKAHIAYGIREDLGRGDSVTKLYCHLYDFVSVLVHSAEVKLPGWQQVKIDKTQKSFKALDSKEHYTDTDRDDDSNSEEDREERNWETRGKLHNTEGTVYLRAGAVWDIFRRDDVPKLNEYLQKQNNSSDANLATNILHGHTMFLNEDHKRKLKNEYQVEPWTIEQNLGEAVLVPAGCPYQVRNLMSCIKLSMDFVSPENLQECVRLENELRFHPKEHSDQKSRLEVKKMVLYASRAAVMEIHKLVLSSNFGDTKAGSENINMTALVLQNLERMKREMGPENMERANRRSQKCY